MFDRGWIGKQFGRSFHNSFEQFLDRVQTTAAAATGPISGHYEIIQFFTFLFFGLIIQHNFTFIFSLSYFFGAMTVAVMTHYA